MSVTPRQNSEIAQECDSKEGDRSKHKDDSGQDNGNNELLDDNDTNHQQMHKESFIINRNTLPHISTLLVRLQGEIFCYPYTKVTLYS
jgi:hypothetical protein